jgi:CRP-like cAMP-binding protein
MTVADGGAPPLPASAPAASAEVVRMRAAGLAEMELFADCSAEQLHAVAQRLRPLRATAGQVLMKQGDEALSFIVIHTGRVEICRTGEDDMVVLDEVPAGQIVGEIALLRGKPRTATVTAAESMTGYIGDDKVFAAMADLPGVSDRLLRKVRQRLAAYITPITVTLADGSVLLLRPVLPGDNERSHHQSVEFSSETLYRRFMSARAPSAALMQYLFEVDYVDHFVWVLIDGEDGPVVADARFVRDVDDASVAEVAFIVADDYQGRGIGGLLMGTLIVAAQVLGVHRFTARLLAENQPMHAILDRFGAQWEREEPGVVTAAFDVPGVSETSPVELQMDPVLADEIRAVTRQVVRAAG